MNKFITIPLVVILLIVLAGVVQGTMTLDSAWIWGLVAAGIVAISVASLLLKDTVLSAIWKETTLGLVWSGLTASALPVFVDGGTLGIIFLTGITAIFAIGLFMDVDGGGD